MPVLLMSADEGAVSSNIATKRIEGVKNRGVRTKGCRLFFFNTRCRIHCGTVVTVRTTTTTGINSTNPRRMGPVEVPRTKTPK